MPSPYLLLSVLLTAGFAVATQLALWREQSPRQQIRSGGVLETVLGDSRRLFANHFLVKADVYLHSGVYPSIFEQARTEPESHLAQAVNSTPAHDSDGHDTHADQAAGSDSDQEHEHDHAEAGAPPPPRDWLEALGRNFSPSRHTHLEPADQREMLPWLRLAAELNPNQVETYTVAAYWLRTHMGKVVEAEVFLREGWRANPGSYEIVFELGRLYEENKADLPHARNLFELALRQWRKTAPDKPAPDDFAFAQITAHLARLEERAGNLDKAISYLEMLQPVSPQPAAIQAQLDELKARAKGLPVTSGSPGRS